MNLHKSALFGDGMASVSKIMYNFAGAILSLRHSNARRCSSLVFHIVNTNTAMAHYRKFFTLLLLLILPLCASAQTKRALVIGLGEQMDKSWSKINGDKDVPYVVSMLKEGGYRDIHTLVNRQATKRGIVSAFQALTNSCHNGDIVYIHFSGHGQQVTDANHDEPDGKDESWIPYGAYLRPCKQDRGEKHLLDDEVNVLLNNLRTKVGDKGKILVVVDACHSGDSTRDADEDGEESDDEAETLRGVKDVFGMSLRYAAKVSRRAPRVQERWITISACMANESNAEMRSPQVGKLTYALSTIVSASRPATNAAMEMELARFFASHRGKAVQTPIITGEKNRYSVIDLLR